MKIIHLDKDLVAVRKPAGMPAQSDPSGDTDALTATSQILRERGEPSALWLVHRLDRTVGGIMVFARNAKSAAELSRLVAEGGALKIYETVCNGVCPDGRFDDFIYKDNTLGKAFVAKTKRRGVKDASLIVTNKGTAPGKRGIVSLCEIRLLTGRFHQIRVQLSSRQHPIVGDKKYGGNDSLARFPALFCKRMSFTLFDKQYDLACQPPYGEYPWTLFDTAKDGEQ